MHEFTIATVLNITLVTHKICCHLSNPSFKKLPILWKSKCVWMETDHEEILIFKKSMDVSVASSLIKFYLYQDACLCVWSNKRSDLKSGISLHWFAKPSFAIIEKSANHFLMVDAGKTVNFSRNYFVFPIENNFQI